jgi:uncharacterized protein (TIGR02246 family)
MSGDEQAIRDLVATWLRATHDGDVEAVLELMTPDVIFLMAGQPPMVGKEKFAQGLRQVLDEHAIDSHSSIDEVAVSGDMAYCRTSLSITITSKHGLLPLRRTGHTLSIMRRCEDGKWRLTRDANMVGPAA